MEDTPSLIKLKKKLLNDIVLTKLNIEKSKNAARNVNFEDLPDKGKKMKEVYKAHKEKLQSLEIQLEQVNEMIAAEDDQSFEISPPVSKSKPKPKQQLDLSASSVDSDKENRNRRSVSNSPSLKENKTVTPRPVKPTPASRTPEKEPEYRIAPESESETESSDSSTISSAEVTPAASPSDRKVVIEDSDEDQMPAWKGRKVYNRIESREDDNNDNGDSDDQDSSVNVSPRKGRKAHNRIESDDDDDVDDNASNDNSNDYDAFANMISGLKGPATGKKVASKFPLSSTAFLDDTEQNGRDSPTAAARRSFKNDAAKRLSSVKSPPESENWQSVNSPSTESEAFYSPESELNASKTSKASEKTPPINDFKTVKSANLNSPKATSSKVFSPRNEIRSPKPSTHAKPSALSPKISPSSSNIKPSKTSTHPKLSGSTIKSPPEGEKGYSEASTFAMPDISSLKISPENSSFKSVNSSLGFPSQKLKTYDPDSSTRSFGSSTSSLNKQRDLDGFVKPQKKVIERPIWEAQLPSKGFNLNEMGKKALETHRAQQAVTLDSLRTIHKSLETMPGETEFLPDPKTLKSGVELMPHQKHALAWLLWREKQKPRGGILADDMGLGKTLTMISLILKNRELEEEQADGAGSSSKSEDDDVDAWASQGSRPKKYPGGTLVIAPASLLSQWEGEVNRRVKSHVLKVLVHHGNKREEKARRLARYDMVITTYGIVQSDGKDPENSPLFKVRWERIIIDEAHQIRNPKTHSSVAVCLLNAKNRWALTGTPIQNKTLDMYGLLKFLHCKPFDDLAVWKRWVDNRDAAGTKRLNTVVKSILLRRTKEQILSEGPSALPPKVLKKVEVTLDSDEKEVYHKLLLLSSTLFHEYLRQRSEKAELQNYGVVLNNKKNFNKLDEEEAFKDHPELAGLYKKLTQAPDIKAHQVLVFLLRLRQMCCHPSLISAMIDKESISADGIEEGGVDIDLMDQFKRMSLSAADAEKSENDVEGSHKLLSSDHPLFSRDRVSSKVRKVIEILEEEVIPSGDKCVIVSQWTGFLSILEEFLRGKKIRCDSLNGTVPIPERGPIVDKFNDPYSRSKILLLSLTAGGCGLNLVGGNRLMLIDIHWNPQLENQACDRIYRVGQKKDVFIYRFVTSDTIEEGIEKLQKQKLETADQVLTGARKIKASQLSLHDIQILFGMDPLQPH